MWVEYQCRINLKKTRSKIYEHYGLNKSFKMQFAFTLSRNLSPETGIGGSAYDNECTLHFGQHNDAPCRTVPCTFGTSAKHRPPDPLMRESDKFLAGYNSSESYYYYYYHLVPLPGSNLETWRRHPFQYLHHNNNHGITTATVPLSEGVPRLSRCPNARPAGRPPVSRHYRVGHLATVIIVVSAVVVNGILCARVCFWVRPDVNYQQYQSACV